MIKDLRDAVSKEDDEQIKRLMPELQQTLYSIGTNLYQQAGGTAPADGSGPDSSGSTSSTGGDDVIDADFTESK